MILHEIYFDGLGGGVRASGPLADAIARDFGSMDRWRSEFAAMGKAEGGGSGWVILAYSPRDKRLVNQMAAHHTTTLARRGRGGVRGPLDGHPPVPPPKSPGAPKNGKDTAEPQLPKAPRCPPPL